MSLSAGARAEQILVRTFALFRLAGMAQVLLALALAVPRASHVPGVGALAAAVLAESGVLVVACWRRNRIPGGWVVGDVAATAAALVAGAWLTGPAAYNTWANFMYPFSLIEILIAGLGLASLPEVILAAAGLAAVYASSAVVIHGDPLWNVVPNAVSYLGNAVVSWLIATELRRSARLLDDQRRLAVSQAEELARAREREHSARLLHDRVLQTLEMLAHPSWIPDEALRRQVAAEASWLRRFVERGGDEQAGSVLDAVHEVCDRHAAGLSLQVNDAAARLCPSGLPAAPPEALAALRGALDEALTNVGKHAGVSSATVRVAPADGGLSVSVLDHGRGFDPAAAEGFGLRQCIRARIREVGGRAAVEAWPGQGTHVELWIPGEDHATGSAG